MIYLIYVVLCASVIWFSTKCAKYIDLIDKKTKISGAFIGGVILATVTSLPELFTSISGILLFDNPGLVIGNVLGSNIFNLLVLGCLIVFSTKKSNFSNAKISNSHYKVILSTILIYIVLFFTLFVYDLSFLNISITSIIIFIMYIFSVKYMASDDSSEDTSKIDPKDDKLTVKTIVIRFVIMALLLVTTSVLITYATDIIAEKLNLGASLAGALFLGIATSLPELSSSISLVRRGNFNTMIGNIAGSNLFNFLIIFISDLIYYKNSIYIKSSGVNSLVIFGFISSIAIFIALILKLKKSEKKWIYSILGMITIISYILFLVFSM